MENKLTAVELRIGNLVLGASRDLITIVDIGIIDHLEKYKSGYKPLPLTEEWLLKFGFFVENFDYSIPISDCEVVWLTLIPQDENCSSYSVCVIQTDEEELDSYVFLSDIKNVHSLQNLYFALTNKELTIK